MRRPLALESLETRRLFTELAITGTPDVDHITVWVEGSEYVVGVNFVNSYYPIASVDGIRISALGGGDGIIIGETHVAVTVTAGAGEDELYVGMGRLDLIRQPVHFDGGADDDTLFLDDYNSVYDDAYTIDRDAAWRTLAGSSTQSPHIGYAGLENVMILGSRGHNRVDVERSPGGATPLGTSTITLSMNNGNDHVRLAPSTGNLGHVRSRVRVVGEGGTNRVTMDDHNWADNVTYTVDATRADWSASGSVTFEQVHGIDLLTGSGTNDIRVNGTPSGAPLTVFGGTGPDTLHLTTGNLTALGEDVIFHGGAGGVDHAIVNDQDWAHPTDYVISNSGVSWGPPSSLTVSGLEALTLNAGSGPSSVGVSILAPSSTNVRVNTGAGVDEVFVHESTLGTATTIETGPGDDEVHVNPDGTGFAAAAFESQQDLAELTIGNGGRVALVPGGASTLRTASLAVAPGGMLNITDNAVAVDYAGASPIAEIYSLIGRGYNGGNWLGTGGITSSAAVGMPGTAVGFAEAVDVFAALPATFAGLTVDATSVLIRHTFYGDANLDGRVNLADFNRLAAHFGHGLRYWAHGNFDYDVDVDLADFNRLAANFGAAAALIDLIG